MDALGLQQLLLALEPGDPFLHLPSDLPDGALHLLRCRHIVAGGIDRYVGNTVDRMSGDRVDLADAVDLVSEEFNPNSLPVGVGRIDLHRIAADPELVPFKSKVVSLVADLDQLLQQFIPVPRLPYAERDHHIGIVNGIPQSVDTADGRHDNHVPAFEQAGRRAVPQAFDLVIDGAVLLDIGIRMCDIRFRLIVIVVADEILHGVVRKKLLELGAQLCCQRLVMRQHQRRPLQLFDHLRHGVGLSASGDPEQGLLLQPQGKPLGNGGDSLRLISGRLVFAFYFEFRHDGPPSVPFIPISRSPGKAAA